MTYDVFGGMLNLAQFNPDIKQNSQNVSDIPCPFQFDDYSTSVGTSQTGNLSR